MISRYLIVVTIVILFALTLSLPKQAANFLAKPPKPQVSAARTTVGMYPIPTNGFQKAPEITASSAAIIDLKTGTTLFEKNSNLKHLPASTAKLMTALIVLEKCSPQTIVTVDDIQKIGNQMGLEAGDQVTVENLIHGLLIKSGNDAAYVLASACSDSNGNFISQMNEKARSLEMLNTRFVNPAGFDDPFQFSTAADLAKLARVAVGNPMIAKIVATKSTVVTDVSGNKNFYLENVNELLGEVNGVVGIKSGQTNGALENLITQTTRDGNSIITIVLGSKDRFTESKDLIEWAFSNYRWIEP